MLLMWVGFAAAARERGVGLVRLSGPLRRVRQVSEARPPLVISCDGCCAAGTDACSDCLVTHLCAPSDGAEPAPQAVIIDLEEMRAIRRLQSAGLAPEHRWVAVPFV